MRETFKNLGDLMGYYQFLKFNVTSLPTLLPKKDPTGGQYNAVAARSNREEKLCFVADVESFVEIYHSNQGGRQPIRMDCLREIFYFALASHIWLAVAFPNLNFHQADFTMEKGRYYSYGQLAKRFSVQFEKEKNIPLVQRMPKRILDKDNLWRICRDLRKKAEEYYIQKGFITDL